MGRNNQNGLKNTAICKVISGYRDLMIDEIRLNGII